MMSADGCIRAALLVAVGVALAAVAGCTPRSCTVDTSELSMVARVVDNGVTVRAEVDFMTGERGDVAVPWQRCDDDRVEINGRTAIETVKDERVEYSLTLDVGAATSFEFLLAREVDDQAVVASVDLPPSFEVLAPEPGITIARTEDVLIRWEPANAGGQLSIELVEEIGDGICIMTLDEGHEYKHPGGVRVDDTGEWLVPGTAIHGDPQAGCEARYILNRYNLGEYPAALADGGFLEAQVTRNVLFHSTP
jgi:hypothetical protein